MQGDIESLSRSSVTRGILKAKIDEVAADGDLEESLRNRLIELYRKALSSLESAKSYEADAIAYARALETAPRETKQIRGLLQDQPSEPKVTPVHQDLETKEIEQQLSKEQANAAAVEAKLSEMEKELENWSQRPADARERITAAKGELEDLEDEVGRPIPVGDSALVAQALRWTHQTRQRELRAELLMLDRDLLSQAALQALLKAKRDKSARDLQMLRSQQAYLVEQIQARRHAQARQARADAEVAKREAAGKHAILQDLAERNSILTDELSELTANLDQVDDKRGKIVQETKRIADEFRNTRRRLEIVSLTHALGQVLIDRRQKLPDQRAYLKEAEVRERKIADATLRQIRYSEEREDLRSLEAYVDKLIVNLEQEPSPELREGLLDLARQRSELLDKALAVDDAYLRVLGNLDYASSELMDTVDRYDDFLAERLLWVRNGPPVNLDTLKALPGAIGWLVSPLNWLQVTQVMIHEAARSPLLWLLTSCILLLLWKRRAIRGAILANSLPLRRVGTDRIGYTLRAIGLSLMLAVPAPLLLVTLGWQLSASLEATPFTKAIGLSGLALAWGLFAFQAFRLLCIPGGVADRHFRWSGGVLKTVRRHFDWAIWVLVPIGFVVYAVYSQENLVYAASLGRISLLLVTIGSAIFIARLLHPKHGVLRNYLAARPQGWANRLRPVWYPLTVAVPVALAVLALLGFVYTAGTLLQSMFHELWLGLALVVIHQVIVRWLVLTRRRLALRSAIEREATRGGQPQDAESARSGSHQQIETPELDLASLDERTRKLLNSLLFAIAVVGVWLVYSDVLPALAVFEEISLWSYTGIVDGEARVIPVTLANIGMLLIIAVVATVAAKNLPALLEILLLQQMSISPGSRYTIKTLTGYFIVGTAAFMIFGTLGLSWSQVQWLVAALGVGIGFGLQEIVANFVSGLIILFERPIRVGDRVTIGETTGDVSNIQIRATTIRNWDKQELLVPNKELITGRLLNWSLSDQLNRIVIPVGVDYGTDIPLALDLLRKTARENRQVLDDPGPVITFEGFGDNALTLILRCYLDSLDNRLSITSDLHQSINEKFRAAGISIALPQRDVHLSAKEPLDVRVHRNPPEAPDLSGPKPGSP